MGEPLISIRIAETKDADAVASLCAQNDEHHLKLRPDLLQPVAGSPRLPEKPGDAAAWIVAESEGRVVGFLSIRQAGPPPHPMFRPLRHAVIDDLVVDADSRGKGVGRTLIEAAKRWSRERGILSVQANVWSANAGAREFYSRQGFKPYTEKVELKLDG